MAQKEKDELSRIATSKAYDAYPISKTNMYNNEWNAKRVGYCQGYEQALKDKSIERSEFDNDMMNAIICLTKQGRHLEEEHIKWLNSLKDRVQPNRWKPNNEQMDALDRAKNSPANYYDIRLALESLYNDLLKL